MTEIFFQTFDESDVSDRFGLLILRRKIKRAALSRCSLPVIMVIGSLIARKDS